jgi:hypothetical protein
MWSAVLREEHTYTRVEVYIQNDLERVSKRIFTSKVGSIPGKYTRLNNVENQNLYQNHWDFGLCPSSGILNA